LVILRRYIISERMLFLVGVPRGHKRCTLVAEVNRLFLVEHSPEEIIEETCQYYGIDFYGALKAASKVIGSNKSGPFIVVPHNTVCLFASKSPLRLDNYYINVQHIQTLEDCGCRTKVFFMNGRTVVIPTRKAPLLARKNAALKFRDIMIKRNSGMEPFLGYKEYEFCRETGMYYRLPEDDDE
jgi:competence protein ComK